MKTRTFFILLLILWLGLSLLLSKFDASADRFTELGFPFTFLKSFSGKCGGCSYKTGFLIKGFLGNLGIILGITLVWHLLKKK